MSELALHQILAKLRELEKIEQRMVSPNLKLLVRMYCDGSGSVVAKLTATEFYRASWSTIDHIPDAILKYEQHIQQVQETNKRKELNAKLWEIQ